MYSLAVEILISIYGGLPTTDNCMQRLSTKERYAVITYCYSQFFIWFV